MGLIDRARAAGRDAKDRVAETVRVAESHVDTVLGDGNARRIRTNTGAALARTATAAKDAGVRGAGRTSPGQAIGRGSRAAVRELAGLPVVGIPADVLAARNGVPELVRRLQAQPDCPRHALWLAEALLRTEADQRLALAARTIVNPTAPAVRALTRTATALGRDEVEPTTVRLLRCAFAGASAAMVANPRDPIALHVVARVYLAQGMPAEAFRLAGLAALADPSVGGPFLTAARARLLQGAEADAKALAAKAIDVGCTVGHEVTAELLRRRLAGQKDLTPHQRSDAFAAELGRATRADRRAYYGTAPGAAAIGWSLARSEATKTATLARRIDNARRSRKENAE